MTISNGRLVCSQEKRDKIKMTRESTKLRRTKQICKVYECKIIQNKLNKAQREALEMIFVEAKWVYNYILSLKKNHNIEIKTIKTKDIKEVVHLDKDGNKIISKLKYLTAQPKQTLIHQMVTNERGISTKLYKKLITHGELKYKQEISSIPLNQYTSSHEIKTKTKVRISGIPGNIKVKGLEQTKNVDEFANALLVKKSDGYYFYITTFTDKTKISNPNQLNQEIGLDFGVKTSLTTSEGEKIDLSVKESERHKKLHQKMKKCQKGSNRRHKALLLLRKEYQKEKQKRREKANKVLTKLKRYKYIVFQNEQISIWKKSGFGKQINHTCLGILKNKLKQQKQSIVLDKYIPTTKFCPFCGKKNRIPLSDRIYKCSCGYEMDRDVHAARNMLVIKNLVFKYLNVKLPTEHREITLEEFNNAIGLTKQTKVIKHRTEKSLSLTA